VIGAASGACDPPSRATQASGASARRSSTPTSSPTPSRTPTPRSTCAHGSRVRILLPPL